MEGRGETIEYAGRVCPGRPARWTGVGRLPAAAPARVTCGAVWACGCRGLEVARKSGARQIASSACIRPAGYLLDDGGQITKDRCRVTVVASGRCLDFGRRTKLANLRRPRACGTQARKVTVPPLACIRVRPGVALGIERPAAPVRLRCAGAAETYQINDDGDVYGWGGGRKRNVRALPSE